MSPSIRQLALRVPGLEAVRRWRSARRGLRAQRDPGLPGGIDLERVPATTNYWRARLAQHPMETYCDVPMSKFPEDLRAYQYLLWLDRVDTVVELGTRHGGSALWFRDTLANMARYGRISSFRVISADVDLTLAREALAEADPGHEQIEIIEADARDPELPGQVRALIPGDARCFVIDDSAHDYETTTAILRGFAPFVPPGGFMVIEDGVVDIEELRAKDWPRGVLPALRDWLATAEGAEFEVRRDLEFYGITSSPGGFLQRRLPPGSRGARAARPRG